MGFRLSTLQEYNRFIAIDIGSYKIRVLICEIKSGELTILGRASVRQARSYTIGWVITDMHGVAETIRRAIDIASKNIDEVPEDIIITLLSDALISDTVTTQYIRGDKDSTLTMEEIDAMIKKIESHSFDRARTKIRTQFGSSEMEIRLISSTLTSIYIDDKRIMNPIGFTGKNVRFTVLNVFAPTSDCNVLRSVISALDRKTISIIPPPLVLSKIIERTENILDTNTYLDIGYSHTTIVIEVRGEIVTFHTLPIGTSLLEQEIWKIWAEKWFLNREHTLVDILAISREKLEQKKYAWYQSVIEAFFALITDSLLATIERNSDTMILKNLFLSGWIFLGKLPLEMIRYHLSHTIHKDVVLETLVEKTDETLGITSEYITAYGLSLIAADLLLIKKDPLIRILRYVLYQYE